MGISVRDVLVIMAALALGTTLLSCASQQPPVADATSALPKPYKPLAPVVRAPLPPPAGYAYQPRPTNSPEGTEPQTGSQVVWRASPRWAAVKGKDCIVVEQNSQAKFRVEKCSDEDADGPTAAQTEYSRGH